MRISDWSSDVCSSDLSVNLATRKFFPEHGTPEGLLALGEAGLADRIKTIGLYKTKARNVIMTCQMLIDQHQSEVPADRAALEALPGVGRKTANVVLNTAFGHPTIAVDTPILRLPNRTQPGRASCRERVCPYVEISGAPL